MRDVDGDRRSLETVERALRAAGWRRQSDRRPAAGGPDLVVRRGSVAYAVELKYAPEARRDRMLPLLAEAILRSQAAARAGGARRSLAVVAARGVRPELAEQLIAFAKETAPDVAAGVVDEDGLRLFSDPHFAELNRAAALRSRSAPTPERREVDLFSGLNQWMLKLLLAPRIDARYLGCPRQSYRNASDLARGAGVSMMSASRLVRRLESERFLDRGAEPLALVRVEELLKRWRAASMRAPREWPLRFALPPKPGREVPRLLELLRSIAADDAAARRAEASRGRPPACLGLFAAADRLGIGHVAGVSPHVYVDDFRRLSLERHGLTMAEKGQPAGLVLREARAPRPLFDAAVERDGVLAADALQIWLDVVDHSARGAEQAREIERTALAPLFKGRR